MFSTNKHQTLRTAHTKTKLFSKKIQKRKQSLKFNGILPATLNNIQYSHVQGPTHIDLIERSWGDIIDEKVAMYRDKEVLSVPHQRVKLSWVALKALSEKFATSLLGLGYVKGDRLGIWLPNCYEWMVVQLATAKIGVVLVNVNPAYRSHELKHAINLTGMKGLVIIPRVKTSDYVSILRELIPDLGENGNELSSDQLPSLKHLFNIDDVSVPGTIKFTDLYTNGIDKEKIQKIQSAISPDDDMNIQFTSGTTGSPKGATLSHRNILNNAYFTGIRLKLSENDVMGIPVPLYHCFGLVLGSMAGLIHGSKLVYPCEVFDPQKVLEVVQEERCTVLHGVPTMFLSQLEHEKFKDYNLSTLRTGIMAGSNCPIQLMKKVHEDMNMKEVTIVYGMTETSPASFQSFVDDPIIKRVETVGRIHDHCEVRIVDENNQVVPVGVTGTLHTKGYSVMKKYWDNPKKTEESIVDGWMNTEDLATIDTEGYCRIVGRTKDMFIRGGENVYPREIEEFLYEHPDIVEVQVIGVPDPKYGEEACAWIQKKKHSKTTEQDIKDYCKGKIAHYKIPRYIIFTDTFPMTITGKIQKFIMREETIKTLKLSN